MFSRSCGQTDTFPIKAHPRHPPRPTVTNDFLIWNKEKQWPSFIPTSRPDAEGSEEPRISGTVRVGATALGSAPWAASGEHGTGSARSLRLFPSSLRSCSCSGQKALHFLLLLPHCREVPPGPCLQHLQCPEAQLALQAPLLQAAYKFQSN